MVGRRGVMSPELRSHNESTDGIEREHTEVSHTDFDSRRQSVKEAKELIKYAEQERCRPLGARSKKHITILLALKFGEQYRDVLR